MFDISAHKPAGRGIPARKGGFLRGALVPSALIMALSGFVPASAQVTLSTAPVNLKETYMKIADTVRPAVVNVTTVYVEKGNNRPYEYFFGSPFDDFFGDFFGDQGSKRRRRPAPERRLEGTGSGTIISPEGHILTNEHVVRDAREITVVLDDEKKYKGKVVGKDVRTDVAVIKINAGRKLPYAVMGDSDKVRVGEWVAAIGSPFGLQHTITSGIVSAVRQSLPIEGRDYRDLIQTDAAINRGNSGGPLCNMKGEVIGVNTAIYAPTGVFSGVGFAIPINNAKAILNDLIKKGKVVRGWLGVEIGPVNEIIAREFSLPDTNGVLVNDVMKDSPAAKAGLRRGDVIREFGGKEVKDASSLQDLVSATRPNTKVKLDVIRDGKRTSLTLVTGEAPNELPREEEEVPPEDGGQPAEPTDVVQWEGLSVATFTQAIAEEFGVPADEKGCIVLSIEPGTTAEEIGVAPGDLVRSINRVATPSTKEFREAIKKTDVRKGVVLDVNRQGRSLFITYTPPGR